MIPGLSFHLRNDLPTMKEVHSSENLIFRKQPEKWELFLIFLFGGEHVEV